MGTENGIGFLSDNRVVDLNNPDWREALTADEVAEILTSNAKEDSKSSGVVGSGHHRNWSKKCRPGRAGSKK